LAGFGGELREVMLAKVHGRWLRVVVGADRDKAWRKLAAQVKKEGDGERS
jgi:hypothetical protein